MANVNKQVKLELQKELDEFQKAQKDIQKCVETRQKLEAQLTENKVVKEELEILEEGANIYKLTGPVLVKQDLSEAKSTVSKRIEYISAEVKRQETSIADLEKEQEKHREKLGKLQSQMSPPAVKA
ncbi:prefoldin subunit 6-like [Clavelina lepadiformis]|uniref:Prefoldin subunit 6 n=1 Tax=Clavelina lepadiformis TaxID=159417 RepID=A0ABP0H3C5_CLALP